MNIERAKRIHVFIEILMFSESTVYTNYRAQMYTPE